MLPISGRLTNRAGGGPVVLANGVLLTVASVPFMFVTRHTPYPLLACVLFVRGLALGAAVQPSVAAAYQLLDSAQVPSATAALTPCDKSAGRSARPCSPSSSNTRARRSLVAALRRGRAADPTPKRRTDAISGPVATAFDHTFSGRR
jgi:hypothetical protein